MKVLLVNPLTSVQSGFRKYSVFPYGILFLAAVLEKANYQVRIYDNNIDDRKPEDFISFNPDLIGFSVITGRSITNAINQAIKFKGILPKTKIVWGGIHPSLLPEQTIIEPYIDYVIIGEGEYTLLELCQYLDKGDVQLEDIKGLVYKQNSKIIINKPRPFIKDLNELPDPAWHFVDVKKYDGITLNTSRGCPFRCTFCYNQAFNKGRRGDFTTRRIIFWIKFFQDRHGVSTFKFYEDNFTINRKRLREFCNLIIQENLKIKWECESRVDLKEEEIVLMAKSGCYAIGLGVESGSPRILKFLQKGIKLENVKRTFKLLAKHDIGPGLYVMAGLPTETVEDFKMTLQLVKRLSYRWCEYMIYRPYPGTVLYNYCVDNNLFKPPEKLAEWVNFCDLYDAKNNLSNIPANLLQKELNKFKKRYIWTGLLFSLKHRPLRALSKILNPYKIIEISSNIIRHYKAFFIDKKRQKKVILKD